MSCGRGSELQPGQTTGLPSNGFRTCTSCNQRGHLHRRSQPSKPAWLLLVDESSSSLWPSKADCRFVHPTRSTSNQASDFGSAGLLSSFNVSERLADKLQHASSLGPAAQFRLVLAARAARTNRTLPGQIAFLLAHASAGKGVRRPGARINVAAGTRHCGPVMSKASLPYFAKHYRKAACLTPAGRLTVIRLKPSGLVLRSPSLRSAQTRSSAVSLILAWLS